MIKEKKASTVLQSLKVCNCIAMSATEKGLCHGEIVLLLGNSTPSVEAP